MTSERGLALIRQFEGLRLKAYPDPASGGDPWTIGFGHTRGVKQGDTCTAEQAEQWLIDDAAEAELGVLRATTANLTQGQLDALVSFVFNLGAGAYARSTLCRKINAGDMAGAAREFARWNLGGGKVMPGLVKRRAAEAALFTSDSPALEPIKEKPVLPFIAAALPALIQAAPALIRIFGDSPRAEKNAKAAELAADIARTVTGEPTIEGAVNAIESDPEKAAAYREQVHLSMGDLLAAMERIQTLDQKAIAAARDYNTAEPYMVDFSWLKLKFIHILSIGFVAFSGAFVWNKWDALTPELKGAVITLMVIAGWNGVKDFWMGSSNGSERKTQMLIDQSKQ